MFQSSSNRHISTSTVQRRQHESGLHGRIAAKKPLLMDANKKKRLALAKKHEQWILDRWKCVLWSVVQTGDFRFQPPCFCQTWCVGERLISPSGFPTVKHGGGGVIVWGCFAGDNVFDLFRIQGTLNQHGYHSILQRYAIPSGLCLEGLSFVFQKDNEPTHLQTV